MQIPGNTSPHLFHLHQLAYTHPMREVNKPAEGEYRQHNEPFLPPERWPYIYLERSNVFRWNTVTIFAAHVKSVLTRRHKRKVSNGITVNAHPLIIDAFHLIVIHHLVFLQIT